MQCDGLELITDKIKRDKVTKYFHKALRPNGILWLGKSETLWGESEMLFKPICKEERIFRKTQ